MTATVLPPPRVATRLENGIEIRILPVPGSGVVSTCLAYRVGTRDEPPGRRGIAHFLEHMMFKGSAGYAPGQIDALTQALGGSNNAYTSHDLTVYYFTFAPDRWPEALVIEADRMRGLTLPPEHVESERQVVLEEISMYAGDPWDALEEEARAALFPAHPYGDPVLGTRETLLDTSRDDLFAFHGRYYGPDNAVLVVAGEVGEDALERVDRAFGEAAPRGAREADPSSPPVEPDRSRIERRQGSVARYLRLGPGPAADTPAHAALRVGLAMLADGRQSRLHQILVEDLDLCAWIQATLSETQGPGSWSLAAELHPGSEPERVEAIVEEELARASREPAPPGELERARAVLRSDWMFGHERVHEQALSLAFGAALFDDGYADRFLSSALAVASDEAAAALAEWAPLRRAVLGWSLPGRGEE